VNDELDKLLERITELDREGKSTDKIGAPRALGGHQFETTLGGAGFEAPFCFAASDEAEAREITAAAQHWAERRIR